MVDNLVSCSRNKCETFRLLVALSLEVCTEPQSSRTFHVVGFPFGRTILHRIFISTLKSKIERMGFTPSCPSCHLTSTVPRFPGFSPSARHSKYVFPKHSARQSCFNPTLLHCQLSLAASFYLLKWLKVCTVFSFTL